MNLPNLLTILRIFLIPIFAVFVVQQNFGAALGTFFIAGISDGLDGFLARKLNQTSNLGRILDPIADKLLMTVAFVVLSLPFIKGENLPVPFWLMVSVIFRDAMILLIALFILLFTKFRGFKPSNWGKASTFVQIAAIGLILLASTFPIGLASFLQYIYIIVFLFTAISGFHYIYFIARLMKQSKD
ncbi:MAG: CDP-alcohol phosphatidyltransferase family protein [Pyrinomonadaceae bacterium]|nr:CDP-alcohol phosphatidyltransferase family protein [Pyrinomonadaceae bacterium]